jgi:hypothetical protein
MNSVSPAILPALWARFLKKVIDSCQKRAGMTLFDFGTQVYNTATVAPTPLPISRAGFLEKDIDAILRLVTGTSMYHCPCQKVVTPVCF